MSCEDRALKEARKDLKAKYGDTLTEEFVKSSPHYQERLHQCLGTSDTNQTSRDVTIEGTYICLPHKDTTGPQTMECATGIHATDESNYALDASGIGYIMGVGTGSEISVSGTLVPIEMISSDHWQTYDIKGIIQVASYKKL